MAGQHHHQQQQIEDGDDDDEFEPLFDYRRVYQPPPDDDSDDEVAVSGTGNLQDFSKRHGSNQETKVSLRSTGSGLHEQTNDGDVEDEDWLPPPPKCARISVEAKMLGDPTLLQLRQKRAELMSLTADSSEAYLKRLEESVPMEAHASEKSKPDFTLHEDQAQEVVADREKVVVSIQNKDGVCKSFRICMGEKFEKLYNAYAQSVGKAAEAFVFCFDGQQISGNSTPKELGIENEDIIEVNIRI